MYKVETTDEPNIFLVTELIEVQIVDNGIEIAEGDSWRFSKEVLEQEILQFQSEISKRNEIINLINQL